MSTIITPPLVPVEHEAPSDLLFLLVDDMGTGYRERIKRYKAKPRQGHFKRADRGKTDGQQRILKRLLSGRLTEIYVMCLGAYRP